MNDLPGSLKLWMCEWIPFTAGLIIAKHMPACDFSMDLHRAFMPLESLTNSQDDSLPGSTR
jgi:hypothetical protein